MNPTVSIVILNREQILSQIIEILHQMTSDWDTGFSGEIGPDTYLVRDLNCESIDIVQFVVAIEERFKRRDFPMEKMLMVDGRYVDDLRVSEVVSFLYSYLNA
jgi:acyl carrier protein